MERERLIQQLAVSRARSEAFYEQAGRAAVWDDRLGLAALQELGTALEALRVAEEHLRQSSEITVDRYDDLEAECRRYRELFELAPDAALVTDTSGIVKAANRTAGDLFGVAPPDLLGRPLADFVPPADRPELRREMHRLGIAPDGLRAVELRVRADGPAPAVVARVRAIRRAAGGPAQLLWALRAEESAAMPVLQERPVDLAAEQRDEPRGNAEVALHYLVTAASTLFHADGVGVMLLDDDGALRWVTASSPRAVAYEKAQARLGEGPCLAAVRQRAPMWTSDVSADPRWPSLGAVAQPLGVRAALCAPVELEERAVGTFNVFLDAPLDWTVADVDSVRVFATLVAALLQVRSDLQRQQTLADQLQSALQQRVCVEQAKGVLMAHHHVDEDQAWALLREEARRTRRKASEVAAEVLEGHLPPLR